MIATTSKPDYKAVGKARLHTMPEYDTYQSADPSGSSHSSHPLKPKAYQTMANMKEEPTNSQQSSRALVALDEEIVGKKKKCNVESWK